MGRICSELSGPLQKGWDSFNSLCGFVYPVPRQGPVRTLRWGPRSGWMVLAQAMDCLLFFFHSENHISDFWQKINTITASSSSPGLSKQACWLQDLWWTETAGYNYTSFVSPNKLPLSTEGPAQKPQSIYIYGQYIYTYMVIYIYGQKPYLYLYLYLYIYVSVSLCPQFLAQSS